MKRTFFHAVLGVLTFGMSFGAIAQSSCDFLALDTVEKALPQYSPWKVMSGGVGFCQFEGTHVENGTRTSAVFSMSQTFRSNAKEASDMVLAARAPSAEIYRLEPLVGETVGRGSFVYNLGAPQMRAFSWFAHAGAVVFNGTFMPPGNRINDRDTFAAVNSLVLSAISTTQARSQLANSARECPHFDAALVTKLLGSGPISVQQLGENSCMANAQSGAVLMVSISPGKSADSAAMNASSKSGYACKIDPIPELGSLAMLIYSCREGNPRAEVWFYAKGATVEFSLIPGSEPRAEARALLVQLAKQHFDRR
jgi:hypothetical protein